MGVGGCSRLGTIADVHITLDDNGDCVTTDEGPTADLLTEMSLGTWYRVDDRLVLASTDQVRVFEAYAPTLPPPALTTVDEFLGVAAGHTWVSLPTAVEADPTVDRPYVTIGDPRDGALSVDGFGGCAAYFSESPWIATDTGLAIDPEHSLGTSVPGVTDVDVDCADRAARLDITDDTRFALDGDQVVVTNGESNTALVALDALPLATADEIDGSWRTTTDGDDLSFDTRDGTVSIGGCSAAYGVDASTVAVDVWSGGNDCIGSESSLTRALVESVVTPRITDDGSLLVLEARSAKRRPIVFALPRSTP